MLQDAFLRDPGSSSNVRSSVVPRSCCFLHCQLAELQTPHTWERITRMKPGTAVSTLSAFSRCAPRSTWQAVWLPAPPSSLQLGSLSSRPPPSRTVGATALPRCPRAPRGVYGDRCWRPTLPPQSLADGWRGACGQPTMGVQHLEP